MALFSWPDLSVQLSMELSFAMASSCPSPFTSVASSQSLSPGKARGVKGPRTMPDPWSASRPFRVAESLVTLLGSLLTKVGTLLLGEVKTWVEPVTKESPKVGFWEAHG